MNWQESIQRYGLHPADDVLPEIRRTLACEIELERSQAGDREDDLALLCCVQLFSRGRLEDVLLIWEAKQSGFDLACAIDVQLLCGAGLERTKEFLQNQRSPEATSALNYILNSEAAGDFVDWSPDRYLDNWCRYFGVNKSQS
ncbi:hypothetical protein H6F67_20730 [Microcoleus sp. FACHB-1515]|uniref:hypothetical protein n=1 Tax=Cyanophyceae TaxID=3028117 RepID=UPI00168A0456|nr:hypothetical protein [Microcoleus sp. FACHB-1515]MBD2092278.1 hypothetical protein [Microcoleus sp. FACHB-1515]